ncbi:head-tail connector protein [Brevundimonas sp. TWP2-3-4b1]|uniref:head-tail connector protein n=1 Tax=Brevundimonas sp. TWP2-3-4b1 TaxID=2804580 RepID=UPI003CEB0BDB
MTRPFAYSPVRTVAPAVTPVTLAEAKAHLRVDHTDDDSLIGVLIEAATGHLDGWSGVLGRALVTQTWSQAFDAFADPLRLPMLAKTVASVTYVNQAGATITVSSADYVLAADALGSFVECAYGVTWSSPRDQTRAVTVTFTAGEAAASVPSAIKAGILLMVGDLYANREGVVTGTITAINPTVSALIAPYRRVGV